MELIKKRNVATTIAYCLTDISGNAVEAAGSLDSEIDGWNEGGVPNGFIDCTNEATAFGSGAYYLTLTAAEMNYDNIYITTKASDAVAQHILIRTVGYEPTGILATSGNVGDSESTLSGYIAPLQVDLDNPSQYKAVGFSTHNPAAIWSEGGRALSTPSDYRAIITGVSLEETVSGVWSLPSRALTTPSDYKADINALALEATVAALNDPTTKEINDYLTGDHGAGSWEGGGSAPTTGEIATGVWIYSNRTLTTPGDYKADVSSLALEASVSGVQAEVDKPDNYKANVTELANISGYIVDHNAEITGVLDIVRALLGDNTYSTFTWTSDDNTHSAIQIYDSSGNASVHDGVNGLLESYSATGTYADNKLQTFLMTRDV